MDEKKKLLESIIEKPSTYEVDVQDNSMLPKNLNKRKTISFTIKAPTMHTLAKCAIHLEDIPEELKSGKNTSIEEAIKHVDKMIKMICVLSWGKTSNYPEWYESFMSQNLTPREVYYIFHESALKMQTDFFLNCFQIANENPMAMRKRSPKD
ncbi:hypothetical protein [Joostella sp.]|uniref:hypothetical protein n=1 Tax=Joostella sp. TaxID=2231138 RepID=UPI003A94D08F